MFDLLNIGFCEFNSNCMFIFSNVVVLLLIFFSGVSTRHGVRSRIVRDRGCVVVVVEIVMMKIEMMKKKICCWFLVIGPLPRPRDMN